MEIRIACRLVALVLAAYFPAATATAQPECGPDQTQWQLIFSDEFDGAAVDTAKWRIENAALVKNNELQYYAPDEVYTQDGSLVLRSRARVYGGRNYTSGLVDTFGKFGVTYGRVEARMKLPRGQGIWPAFWMLPADGAWPPEIDIMEMLGHNPNTVYTTHHWGSWPNVPNYGCSYGGPDYSQDFHTFSVEWLPDRLNWYIDGTLRCFASTPIPNRPMYVILNTAVGGDWPGNPNAQTVFPQYTMIDYVRVYRRADLPTPNAMWNVGFEDGAAVANPPVPLPSWTPFGSVSKNSAVSRTGGNSMKVFGVFNGQPNLAGATQSLDAKRGETWTAAAWVRRNGGDLLAGSNSARVRMDWLDSSGAVITASQATVLTSATAANTWFRGTVTGVAPSGTDRVRLSLLVEQVANAAGAAYFDDVSLLRTSAAPLCAVDIDGNDAVTVNDLFTFLGRYFGGCTVADFNQSGGISVQDIFDFLAAYFLGCP